MRELLRPGEVGRWGELPDRLNRVWVGWSGYFSHGTRLIACRAVDDHVSEYEDFCGGGRRCPRAAPGSSAASWCLASWAWQACAGYTWDGLPRQPEGASRPESRMREIRKSASMSGDGKRDHDAPGLQSTRARSRLYPRGEAKCLRGPSLRGARRLTKRNRT